MGRFDWEDTEAEVGMEVGMEAEGVLAAGGVAGREWDRDEGCVWCETV